MKSFITLKSPEVYHGDDTVSIGVYGLEGSKPGAAAVGVLLSHRVSHFYEVEHKFNFFCCLIKTHIVRRIFAKKSYAIKIKTLSF